MKKVSKNSNDNLNEKSSTKKVVKRKVRLRPGKAEFLFNFFSLIFLISLGVYFGSRSLYYYSKQNVTIVQEAQTLNGVLLNNNVIAKGEVDGLHMDEDGHVFKGNVSNNYVSFGNRLYRILRINTDNSIRLVSNESVASFMYGEDVDYKTSNVRKWLTKTKNPNSGIYYDTIPSFDDFFVETKYSEDVLEEGKVDTSKTYNVDYVSMLSISDYIGANGKNSFLNNGKIFFLLGLDKENNILYIDEDGSVQSGDPLDGYGIRPVITLKPNVEVAGGTGVENDPYIIKQDNKTNKIDSYVKLGEDIWRVFYDKDGILKLYKNDYIRDVAGNEILLPYSNTNSIFDLRDRHNIAYYLNRTYLANLPYSDILLDVNFPTGEISTDRGYNFYNIYTDATTCKVGLLSIFDYVSNNSLEDYYYINLTSEIGSMEYIKYSDGLLAESNVNNEKHIIPVISINSSVLTGGDGSINNPYVMG